MSLNFRPYEDGCDYWRVRAFLRDLYGLHEHPEWYWSLLRWDYWRWHVHENIFRFNLAEVVTLWEAGSQIVAMLHPDGPGEACLQVHPTFGSAALLEEMVNRAEVHLAQPSGDAGPCLRIWVAATDPGLQSVLAARGYQKRPGTEYQRRRSMSEPIPATPIPAGYAVRPLGDESDLPARSWVSWKAFHPGELDQCYRGWEWYRNVQRIPLYRRDLDIVAVTPSGEHAAFSTAWFDDVTRTVVFEPVGTHPDHQRRGLGRAVMAEGLRRAERLGATSASVGSYSAPAHALYASMGFVDYDLLEPWDKRW